MSTAMPKPGSNHSAVQLTKGMFSTLTIGHVLTDGSGGGGAGAVGCPLLVKPGCFCPAAGGNDMRPC